MRVNLREGFRRTCLLLYGCWIVGCLFYIGLYSPVTSALNAPGVEQMRIDFEYRQCQYRVDTATALLLSERGVRRLGEPATKTKKKANDDFTPTPYGLDAGRRPLTREEAEAGCESERRRAEEAVKKTPFSSYLRAEYSLSGTGAAVMFVAIPPILAYYAILAVTWAAVRAGRWIKHGFRAGDDPTQ